jgi:carbonic anhydrase
MTKDKQKALTPDAIIQSFKDGNRRFVEGNLIERNFSQQIQATSGGQYPEAIVLSCIDSRVPVEIVFDCGIGDVFVARVAGNIANPDILGSMEFSCKVAGAKVILVMGHSHCGAIESSIEDVKFGNITGLLEKIRPSVEKNIDYKGERTIANAEYVNLVGKDNVAATIAYIRKESLILNELENKCELRIAGAFYDIDSGRVDFLEE